MTTRNRQTLKKFFGDGEMPSASNFGDLIESMFNVKDDGISHTDQQGLCLTQIKDGNKLLSFYGANQEKPAWTFDIDTLHGTLGRLSLEFVGEAGPGELHGGGCAVLTLLAPAPDAARDAGDDPGKRNPRVGISNDHPQHALDVGGTVASAGRIGSKRKYVALADGQWHTISDDCSGCTALEIVAGAGKEKSGKYALMHAFALKTFDAKGHFTVHQARYDTRRNRMELRWLQGENAKKDSYVLQIRVNCSYGDKIWIQYYITDLWFDAKMTQCAIEPEQKESQ